MTPPIHFSPHFDRAVAACAHAQVLSLRATEATARAREMRQSATHVRRRAMETREAWKGAALVNSLMQRQVVSAARAMRAAGIGREDAVAAVRAHIRFVLYDGGLRQREAEPIVERANVWVEQTYLAA